MLGLLNFRVIFALAFCLSISVLANFHMHKKTEELEKQLSSCEDTLQTTPELLQKLLYNYAECRKYSERLLEAAEVCK